MEISPKLTSASSLNANVTTKGSVEADASTSTLKNAAQNNSDAAAEIAKLTSNQDSAAVASANLSSSRVSPDEVDNLAKSLKERITSNPDQAFNAISTKLTPDTVKLFLS